MHDARLVEDQPVRTLRLGAGYGRGFHMLCDPWFVIQSTWPVSAESSGPSLGMAKASTQP